MIKNFISNSRPQVEGVATRKLFEGLFSSETMAALEQIIETKVQEKIEIALSDFRKGSESGNSDGVDKQVSIDEICAAFGVTRPTIHRWMNLQLLPFKKVGRLTRFRLKDVNELIESGKLSRYNRVCK